MYRPSELFLDGLNLSSWALAELGLDQYALTFLSSSSASCHHAGRARRQQCAAARASVQFWMLARKVVQLLSSRALDDILSTIMFLSEFLPNDYRLPCNHARRSSIFLSANA